MGPDFFKPSPLAAHHDAVDAQGNDAHDIHTPRISAGTASFFDLIAEVQSRRLDLQRSPAPSTKVLEWVYKHWAYHHCAKVNE